MQQLRAKTAMIRRERRVVQAPIQQVVVRRLYIPFSKRRVQRQLHPMALRLVVAKLWRLIHPTVRENGNAASDSNRCYEQAGPSEAAGG